VHLTRRTALLGLATSSSLGGAALALAAAPGDRRLVVVILRGALDGMAAVVPYGDPVWPACAANWCRRNRISRMGCWTSAGSSACIRHWPACMICIKANEALAVHTVAGAYRVRSHFEAQDLLEPGTDHRLTSSWLNRTSAAMPPTAIGRTEGDALAIGVSVPLLLRGSAQVANWAPRGFSQPAPDLYATIAALNQHDPVTGPAIAEGLRIRGFSSAVMEGGPERMEKYAFPAPAHAAGVFLRAPDEPRIDAPKIGGWDIRTAEANRLSGPLKQLDAGLVAMKAALGPVWAQTAVLVMTEFGRTARVNGTKGTDHGTATVAFVVGGAVAGGRVLTTWPGLRSGQLFENRDLAPTTDLLAVAKGIVASYLGLDSAALGGVFPDSGGVGAMAGLIRT
jgi:uncharacterized protein (DUF1501 family)